MADDLLYRCPITQEVMENPVTLIGDGQTYEEEAVKIWLEDSDKSPLTGAQMSTKELCVNFAMKNLIAEWRKSHASDVLRKKQAERFESFFKSNGPHHDTLDIEILVGEDKTQFRCIRSMVGVLSPFFRELLLSESCRDQTTFEVNDVSPVGFEQIIRTAYHLSSKVTTENVIETLTASHICGVEALKHECLSHLGMNISDDKVVEKVMIALEPDNDYGIDEELHDRLIGLLLNRPLNGENVMTVFNSALSLKMLTPALEAKCCRVFSSQATQVTNSPSFLTTRPELMQELVASDFFHVNEELLWKRVCAWCVQQLENEADESKAKKGGDDATEEKKEDDSQAATDADGSEDVLALFDPAIAGVLGREVLSEESLKQLVQLRKNVNFPPEAMRFLEPLIMSFRFSLMDVGFFADSVAPLLPRELADNVLFNKVMSGRETKFNTETRVDPEGNTGPSFSVVNAFRNLEQAKLIPDPSQEAQWSRVKWGDGGGPQWFVGDCFGPTIITRFEWKNHYEDNDTVKAVDLYGLPPSVTYTGDIGASEEHWQLIQHFDIAKSTAWQAFEVSQSEEQRARYFKWVVSAIWGEDNNYTCVNTVKLETVREGWTTHFANKLK